MNEPILVGSPPRPHVKVAAASQDITSEVISLMKSLEHAASASRSEAIPACTKYSGRYSRSRVLSSLFWPEKLSASPDEAEEKGSIRNDNPGNPGVRAILVA